MAVKSDTVVDTRTQSSGTRTLTPPVPAALRTTVLPRLEPEAGAAKLVVTGKPRYEVVSPLGAGGQAEVTLARDHDIDREVAVKRLLPDQQSDDAILRFTDEIRTIGQLEHPNIVPIHDVGVDASGQYFFVMKYVQGETLESIIEKLRAGDPAYVARYTHEYRAQICNEILRGIEHAHAHGILHRDLKPANIMVGSRGEVVIMDWGIAKRVGAPEPAHAPPRTTSSGRLFQTEAGALVGTPAYMSPEQAAGRLDEMDARSDVYSLSVLFYEFLSLRHPRRNVQTVHEMIAKVMHEPVSMIQLLNDFNHDGAAAAYSHLVRHGLEHEPAKRYATVTAMRERLELIRDGRAPIECPFTFAQALVNASNRGLHRHPFVFVTLMAFTTLALLAGGILLLLHAIH